MRLQVIRTWSLRVVLHAYAKLRQREEAEYYWRALIAYNTAAPYQKKGSTLKPPERSALLEWELP